MGYFSNGTEGAMYEEHYCARCVHGGDKACPVWSAHLFANYDQQSRAEMQRLLDGFIPRTPDGLDNEECRMFVEAK